MHLLCFAKSRGEAASTRQRVTALIKIADQLGWRTRMEFVPALPRWNILPQRWGRFVRHWRALAAAGPDTVILLQRTLRCPEFYWLLKLYRPKLRYVISDFDDAVWTHRPADVDFLLQMSDEVWCGSRTAVDYCSARHARVRFVPTTVDTRRFAIPRNEELNPVIGWVGDIHAHRDNLVFFAGILTQIHRDLPPFTLRLLGVPADDRLLRNAFSDLSSTLELAGWIPPGEVPNHIARFSVGVMPLTSNAFNAGKSALKLIEYLAAGVPVVASDVGENRFVVNAPQYGYTATTEGEWRSALAELLANADVRRTKGENGKKFVQEHYDVVQVYTSLLRELSTVVQSLKTQA